jgi:hypothetical protein
MLMKTPVALLLVEYEQIDFTMLIIKRCRDILQRL